MSLHVCFRWPSTNTSSHRPARLLTSPPWQKRRAPGRDHVVDRKAAIVKQLKGCKKEKKKTVIRRERWWILWKTPSYVTMTWVCELLCWKMFMGAVVFHMLANKPLFILVKITKKCHFCNKFCSRCSLTSWRINLGTMFIYFIGKDRWGNKEIHWVASDSSSYS